MTAPWIVPKEQVVLNCKEHTETCTVVPCCSSHFHLALCWYWFASTGESGVLTLERLFLCEAHGTWLLRVLLLGAPNLEYLQVLSCLSHLLKAGFRIVTQSRSRKYSSNYILVNSKSWQFCYYFVTFVIEMLSFETSFVLYLVLIHCLMNTSCETGFAGLRWFGICKWVKPRLLQQFQVCKYWWEAMCYLLQ